MGLRRAVDRAGCESGELTLRRTDLLLTFIVASGAAFSIWALSPWLTGYQVPWNAAGAYYGAALLLAGAVSGLIKPVPLWAHDIGA